MSPISTARLNPQGLTFCLAEPTTSVLIPILLNNTTPSSLTYSIVPLGYTSETGAEKIETVHLSGKDLKALEQARLEVTRSSASTNKREYEDEYDEYDDEDSDVASDTPHSQSILQKTQSLVHIRLSKFGTVRLEQITDSSNVEARLAYPSEVTVVPCPRVEFIEDTSAHANVRCAGQNNDLELMIDIRGVPPLSLRWFKVVNGRPEHFIVEGIDSDLADGDGKAGIRRKGQPHELKVPLTVSLNAAGSYLYALEEVVDSLGNTVRLEAPNFDPSAPNTKTTRSLMVLRTPTVSFKNCAPGSPASLLIGSEAHLSISMNDADALDAPWEVSLSYSPPAGLDDEQATKRHPWKKTLATLGNRRELDVKASAPGTYTISRVQGKVGAFV
jgi:nucleoporin POM152